ncbi:prisilkin-39-like [Amphibalanus amphitrite]|uniref:prisilkin-39-like n=1 Tax=Amphibalanus amphitrite TaxID=1232801 RepID=UPI001C8FB6A9|nr:prisilkin-39-like [Amphibalanus amphitrite]
MKPSTAVVVLGALLATFTPSYGTFHHKGKGKGGNTFIRVTQFGAGGYGHRGFRHGGYSQGGFGHSGFQPSGYQYGGYGYGPVGYGQTGYGVGGYGDDDDYGYGSYGHGSQGLGSYGQGYGHGYGLGQRYRHGGYNRHHSNLIIEEHHSHGKGGGFFKGIGNGILSGFNNFFGKGKGVFGDGHDYEFIGVLSPKFYNRGHFGVSYGGYGGFRPGYLHGGYSGVY